MRTVLAAVLAALIAGCAHAPDIIPVPGHDTDPQHPNRAATTVAGVQLALGTHAWGGVPRDLPWLITPLEVTLQNDSGRPLRIALKDFALRTESGFLASAVPPYRIHMTGVPTAVPPGYEGSGFFVARPYTGFYPGYPPWTGPFDVDPDWYGNYSYWSPPLPSPDMLSRALPEGVLNPNGRVRGFVYFQRVPNQSQSLTFTAKLVDANTGKPFGSVEIPLYVNP